MRIDIGRILGTVTTLVGLLVGGAVSGQVASESSGVKNKVTLQLQLSGLGQQGCIIEIKPAHPACSFKPVKFKVGGLAGDRAVTLDPIVIDANSTGADRDCSFAITLREPGQNPRTFQRGLRLAEQLPAQDPPEKTLKCYLSVSSMAGRADSTAQRR